jgi:hypothetical protein
MKNAIRFGISVLFVTLASGFVTKMAMAQDPAQVAQQNYKVLFENDRVRVLEYRSKPGDKAVMHVHPDYFVYNLSAYKIKFTAPDGKTVEPPEAKVGAVTWRGAETHATENVGTTDAHVLIVELKK